VLAKPVRLPNMGQFPKDTVNRSDMMMMSMMIRYHGNNQLLLLW